MNRNDFEIWKWQIPSQGFDSQGRADKVILLALQQQPPQLGVIPSRSRLSQWLEDGLVKANDKVIHANARLQPGMWLEISIPAPVASTVMAENLPLDILFQDEHLLIINKPQGMSVHPSSTEKSGTVVNALLHHIKDLSGIGGVLRPGIVHRLDKMTSGSLVIAKSDECHRKLSELFSKHELKRLYWALCYGKLNSQDAEDGVIQVQGLMGRNPKDRKKMILGKKGGRQSLTNFRCLESYQRPREYSFASWVEASLETGRTHQVRVHLTHLGHSILGDAVYGQPSSQQSKWKALPPELRKTLADTTIWPGQALHAQSIEFRHPMTQKILHCEAEPPKNFSELLASLQKYR